MERQKERFGIWSQFLSDMNMKKCCKMQEHILKIPLSYWVTKDKENCKHKEGLKAVCEKILIEVDQKKEAKKVA